MVEGWDGGGGVGVAWVDERRGVRGGEEEGEVAGEEEIGRKSYGQERKRRRE